MARQCWRPTASKGYAILTQHLRVDVVPAPRLMHEAADLMHALRAPVDAAARDKLHHTRVTRLRGMTQLQPQPFNRRQFQFARRRGRMPGSQQVIDPAHNVGAVAGAHQRFGGRGVNACGQAVVPSLAARRVRLFAAARTGEVARQGGWARGHVKGVSTALKKQSVAVRCSTMPLYRDPRTSMRLQSGQPAQHGRQRILLLLCSEVAGTCRRRSKTDHPEPSAIWRHPR